MGIVDDYVEYSKKYKNMYHKSIVLIQVGSFYELYGYDNQGANVDEICQLLEIQSTRKNKSINTIDKKNPKMGGIPLYVLDKYLDVLMENSFVVILVEQTTPPPEPKREVTRIITPATRDVENCIENNYLMCLYLSIGSTKIDKFIIGSLSYVDVNTNHSYIFETNHNDTNINLEDIYKTIITNRPSEIVIFTDIQTKSDENFMNVIKQFIKTLNVGCIHNKIDLIINENFFKISYQKTLLEKVFKNTGLLSVIEYLDLENYPISTICYTYLLQFIYQNNEKILEGLEKLVFLETNKYLSLINNVVENLNIINNYSKLKTSSILNLLNNCKTSIGKRFFKESLLNPLTDIKNIEKRYLLCESFIENDIYIKTRELLCNISDLEKIFKKIIIKTIEPRQILQIHKSLHSLKELYFELKNNNFDFSKLNWNNDFQNNLLEFINFCENKFYLINLENTNINQISKNIFNKNVHPEIDNLEKEIIILQNIFENVCLCLNENNENNTEFKLEVSKGINKDKIIRTIVVTKNRYENMLKDKKRSSIIDNLLKEKCGIELKDIDAKPLTVNNKTSLKIIFKGMDSSQIKLIELQNKFREKIIEFYLIELDYIYNKFGNNFINITKFISDIDFYSNNAFNSISNCYCKPNIYENSESYIKAQQIRHPLIEKINIDVPYIANDIEIGTENKNGMLLYGYNGSGKSSLLKSIGINLILAQAGMFVAAKSFQFSPYDHIFSRIPSGDDILKGQSTFVAEISELRTILKRSTNRSIVISDELCSGTEYNSALSIIGSTIVQLSKQNTSFLMASHLHQITDLNCIKNLSNINIYHIEVLYNSEKDCLIYNRLLKDGQGSRIYGLEVCKSLNLPKDFLSLANELRNEIEGNNKNLLEPKKSVYNNLVFMDQCSLCKKECEEVHHITEQQYANRKGIIESKQIHKNVKSNLMTICTICHDKIHNNEIKINGFLQTSNGVVLEYEVKEKIIKNDIEKKIIELRNNGKSFQKIFEIINNEKENQKITLYMIKKIIKNSNL